MCMCIFFFPQHFTIFLSTCFLVSICKVFVCIFFFIVSSSNLLKIKMTLFFFLFYYVIMVLANISIYHFFCLFKFIFFFSLLPSMVITNHNPISNHPVKPKKLYFLRLWENSTSLVSPLLIESKFSMGVQHNYST